MVVVEEEELEAGVMGHGSEVKGSPGIIYHVTHPARETGSGLTESHPLSDGRTG